MIRRLYAIYDLKARSPINGIIQAFGNDEEAERMFRAVVVADGTMVFSHPDDFGLCCVGSIDYDTLIVTPTDLPIRPILLGTDVVRELRARANSERSDGTAVLDVVK